MSDQPHGMLAPVAYQAQIREAADGVLAAIAKGSEKDPVPTCPGWTLRELVDHLGRVHEWASVVVATGERQDREAITEPADEDDLAGWYDGRVRLLLDTLAATDPERDCWTHQAGNQRVAYWSRRQAHEAAMHRVDAELTVGGQGRYASELAADGIGEVLDLWMPRMANFRGQAPDLTDALLFECADSPERWLILPVADALPTVMGPVLTDAQLEGPSTRVRASASDILLTLWKRASPALPIDGDTTLAGRFFASALTP